ncbi:hypothetical protein [Maritimibacter sp. DP1N21-5]|nr:hypothetical protein [Maritimibacter sp. DP1N21-5]MBV7408350.1 hypothetical protein [Maritimibacter sp. DP1N21-5]
MLRLLLGTVLVLVATYSQTFAQDVRSMLVSAGCFDEFTGEFVSLPRE